MADQDCMRSAASIGFTLPAQGGVHWNGEAMTTTDYQDLDEVPEVVASTRKTMAANAVHLASLLRKQTYPAS